MNWLKYLRPYRRFEQHSLKEVVLQKVLPNDWSQVVPADEADVQTFDLSDSSLYTPADNKPHQRGAITGFIAEEGVLWPAVGGLRTQTGHLIKDSFLDASSRRFAIDKGYLRRFPRHTHRGAAATLGEPYRNYYHRWADSIPRIYALYHPACAACAPVTLFVDDRFSGDELGVIEHLLPEYVQLEVTDPAVRVQADRCIYLPHLSSDRTGHSRWFSASAGFIPNECLDWLRNEVYAVTGCEPAAPFRKLYVTRRNAKVRRVRNEAEVADYLTDRGFEVVALEERPFREQVQLFAEAEVVVAQHGAGLINLLFAQSPRVLEILSDQDRQIYFSLISKSRGFTHEQWPMDGNNKNDDVTVPIEQLETQLGKLREAQQDTPTGTGSFP
jgi:hypothetical protein